MGWLLWAVYSAPAAAIPAETSPELRIASVQVNSAPQGEAALLRYQQQWWASRESWLRWRLPVPSTPALAYAEREWWPLNSVAGFVATENPAQQSVAFAFAAEAFVPTEVNFNPRNTAGLAQRPRQAGAYLNYELVGNHQSGGASGQTRLDGQFEAVAFHRWGSVSSQWLALDNTRQWTRLDSQFRHDDAASQTTFIAGDTVGKAGLWGQSARFGGLQFGRNFGTQPQFITVPQPQVRGATALPSVLNVVVDGIQRQQLNVPAGAFVIDNLPAVDGLGEVQVQVRDVLGRDQLIRQPYLYSGQQLRAGLHDYSYELGMLREGFASNDDRYRRWQAVAQHQYGFSNQSTGEVRLELRSQGGITAGAGGLLAVPSVGVLTVAGVVSREQRRTGGLLLLGFQRVIRGGASVGLRYQGSSVDFSQTGQAASTPPAQHLLAANAGVRLGARFTLGLGYLRLEPHTHSPRSENATLNLSTRWRQANIVLLAAQRRNVGTNPNRDQSLSLLINLPLGRRTTFSSSLNQQQPADGERRHNLTLTAQQNLPDGEGTGWRVSAAQDFSGTPTRANPTRAEAAVFSNARQISTGLEVAGSDDQYQLRGTLAGSVLAFGGHAFSSRRIQNSFAVVETGLGGVPLQLNGQHVATSDANGWAVVPNVQPFVENRISAEASNLPLSIQSRASTVTVHPYFRSGLAVPLLFTAQQAVLLELLDANGQPIATGKRVRFGTQSLVVGRKGRVFIADVTGSNRVTDDGCTWRFKLPARPSPQPLIGPLACQPKEAP
jgi:outer membrane usher protein